MNNLSMVSPAIASKTLLAADAVETETRKTVDGKRHFADAATGSEIAGSADVIPLRVPADAVRIPASEIQQTLEEKIGNLDLRQQLLDISKFSSRNPALWNKIYALLQEMDATARFMQGNEAKLNYDSAQKTSASIIAEGNKALTGASTQAGISLFGAGAGFALKGKSFSMQAESGPASLESEIGRKAESYKMYGDAALHMSNSAGGVVQGVTTSTQGTERAYQQLEQQGMRVYAALAENSEQNAKRFNNLNEEMIRQFASVNEGHNAVNSAIAGNIRG